MESSWWSPWWGEGDDDDDDDAFKSKLGIEPSVGPIPSDGRVLLVVWGRVLYSFKVKLTIHPIIPFIPVPRDAMMLQTNDSLAPLPLSKVATSCKHSLHEVTTIPRSWGVGLDLPA